MPPRKKTPKKTAARKRAKKPAKTTVQRIQDELPAELRAYRKRVQLGLSRLEKQIDTAQRDARKRFTRLLRDVSHQLGGIEAAGERQWRQRTARARQEAVKLLRRLEQTLESKKKPAAKPVRLAPRKVVARPAPSSAPKPAAAAPAAKPAAPAAARPAAPPAARPVVPTPPRPLAAPAPAAAKPSTPTPSSGSGSGGGWPPRSGS